MKQTLPSKTLFIRVAFCMLTVSLLWGCHPSKTVVTKPNRHEMDALKSLIIDKSPVKALNSKVEFWFSGKEGVSTSMKGSIKVKSDSCMILSLQPFVGIEIARCLLSPDSIVIVSRLHQIYAVENLKDLPFSTYGLYKMLEQMLTNRMFIPGLEEPKEKDLNKFVWLKQKDGMKLSLDQQSYALSYLMDSRQQYKQMMLKTDDSSSVLTVAYDDFQDRESITFPNRVEVNAKSSLLDNKSGNLKLKVTYLKPVFNSKTDFSFPIPTKYKRVTVNELIKRFGDML